MEIQNILDSLTNNILKRIQQWIPSHRNIKGNEMPDLAAKKNTQTLNNPTAISKESKKYHKRN